MVACTFVAGSLGCGTCGQLVPQWIDEAALPSSMISSDWMISEATVPSARSFLVGYRRWD